MFFASLLLHLIVIAAVIMTVPGASRQLTFGAPYSVALVGPEVLQSPQEASGPKNLLQPSQPAHSVILKRKPIASEAAPLIKKDETGKPDIEKAISAIKQKELSNAESNKTSKAPPSRPCASNLFGRKSIANKRLQPFYLVENKKKLDVACHVNAQKQCGNHY